MSGIGGERMADRPGERIVGPGQIREWWATAPRWVRWSTYLALVVLALLLPSQAIGDVMTPQTNWQTALFYPIGIYMLLALGLNVVVGLAGLLDLGYVAFFAIGGYSMAVLGTKVGWNFWEILVVGVLATAVSGLVLGAPTLRLRGDYLAIVTLGFGEIVRITAQNIDYIGGPRGIAGIPHPPTLSEFEIFGVRPLKYLVLDPRPYYYLLVVVIVVTIIFAKRLENSRVGRAWAAIREDEDAAELMGVPTFRFKLAAFAIGASIGGAAGVVWGGKAISIIPANFPFILSATILAAVVLGGSGNIPGVMLGAFLIAWLPERFRQLADYRVLAFGAVLVLMMALRPEGLLPSRQRKAEFAEGGGGMGSMGGGGRHSAGRWVGGGRVNMEDPASATPPAGSTGATAPPDGRPLLEMKSVTMRFGGLVALNAVDLTIREGEIFALIGPNGAGKTTVFNVVTGVYQPSEGQVDFDGGRIDGKKRFAVTKLGVARTFQNIRLFHNMSALENVMVGADAHHRTGIGSAALGLPWHRREEREGRAKARELLEFVGIPRRLEETAKNLPYGDQRRLEIARALATDPKLLMLDEPAAGMNPAEKESLQDLIRKIRASGRTVLLIEHDMSLVMGISDRIAVLDFGEKIAEGLPAEVQNNPRVIEAYLGAPADAS